MRPSNLTLKISPKGHLSLNINIEDELMKQAGYSKRPQGRSSDRHRQPQRHSYNDSNEGKSRGNPQQFVEKYLTLARDAASSGDPISAENYYQYADHYYRLVLANRPSRPHHSPPRPQPQEQETIAVEPSPEETPSLNQ